ncbi:glycosyl hydrolase [Actinotalea solisilvae]|uniref:glycosyl hydrolase n=1 Tax=Actinotalea solisilvae TaxID=2072922 RepID=UPI0018F1ACD5|nr:glycosyl hydrolase [Actinotalea solisilvae]
MTHDLADGRATAGTDAVGRRRPRWSRPPRLVPALVAAVLALGLVPTGEAPAAAADAACAPDVVTCLPRMAFGLSTEGLPTSTTAFDALEASVGRSADVALSFTSFRFNVDAAALRALAAAGTIPMITWEPFDASVPTQDRYPLRDIAAGVHDAYLREQATRIGSVDGPVAVRFAHEMNGGWYPWGAGVNGNTPADYVDAYRHVHDLFAAQGVDNVLWVWSPASLDTATAPDLAPFYPGDAYVDWAGLSVYLDATTDTWTNTVAPTVRQLDRVAPSTPIYFAETGVLPGTARPAMLTALLDDLLRTPRAIGFTYFNIPSRVDWRIDRDPAALTAVRTALASGWYVPSGTTAPAPLLQVAPAVVGTPLVGTTLTATTGTWRGAGDVTGRWSVCADATAASCTTTSVTAPSLEVGPGMLGKVLRYQVEATGEGGATSAVSAPTTPVVVVPARPARPAVESRSGGARVTFPAAPLGTTHWRLVLDGKPYGLVPVATTVYWLTGMTNGTSHTLALSAVAVTGSTVLESPTTSGTFTPMTQQYSPYVSVTGTSMAMTLPKPPAGAEAWQLTVAGETRTLPAATTATTVTVPTGAPVAWTLSAAAGRWDGVPYGSTTVPSTGSVTPLATPAAPTVTPGTRQITLTFPTPPAGATAWRVSVGATTYADVPVGTPSLTATGLYPGYPSTWTVRAVNATARSLTVTGRAAAL